MKQLALAIAATCMLAAPTMAQAEQTTPGKQLAETIFGSIEDNPDGLVDLGEFVQFGKSIIAAIDADDNSKVTFEEFSTFDFGFDSIATDADQERAYDTARKIVFAFWDRDGNGTISPAEFHKSMVADFQRADVNGDAFLTKEEYLQNYIINKAYRAALAGR